MGSPATPPASGVFPVEEPRSYSRRSRSLSYRKRLTQVERVELVIIEQEIGPVERPKTRADCVGGARPCPFAGCRFHLYIEVERTGTIKLNHPDVELEELRDTCALDVADRGGATLDEVGSCLNVTRERTRQIETRAVIRFRHIAETRFPEALAMSEPFEGRGGGEEE